MKIGSLFSGIGGLELGLEAAGLGHTVWQVEQSLFCRDVLAKHWPEAERYRDVRYVGAKNLEPVQLLAGGFPCQDISSAGHGAGLSGDRSGLWFEFARIIEELLPQWVVVENVASGAERWVDQVRTHLGQLGYETLPIPISAKDVGAPHLRRRIFIVAHTDRVGLWEQQQRDPGRERVQDQGQEVAPVSRQGRDPSNSGEVGRPRGMQGGSGSEHAATPRPGAGRSASDANHDREPTVARLGEVASSEETPGHGGRERGKSKPGVCGVDNGFSAWMDGPTVSPAIDVGNSKRISALGNSVVPQCAEVIGHIVRELAS